MKFLRTLAIGILLTTSHFAYAFNPFNGYDHCDPCYGPNDCDFCNVDFCNMTFSAYIDALYWHGCGSDLFIDTGTDRLSPDYEWGWRVGAMAKWHAWDFGLRYTSFDSKDEQEVDFGSLQIAIAECKIDYSVLDVEVGASCCPCDGLLLRSFVGGKFAEIKTTHNNIIEFNSLNKRKLDGNGLYIGTEGNWRLCNINLCDCCIPVAFVYRVSTGVLNGEFKRTITTPDPGDPSQLIDIVYEECQFVPVHEVYTGLEFKMDGPCCLDAFFQIGYEAQYWGWMEEFNNSDIAHLGFGGLVLRFGAHF